MRHNGRPPIYASDLPITHLDLRLKPEPKTKGRPPEGPETLIVCPDCGWWVALKRHMVHPHRDRRRRPIDGRVPRCPGSGQRVIVNISYDTWREQLAQVVADASTRRSAPQFTKPRPPVPPAVHQIARAREKALAAALAASGTENPR
ncbi:hypothetical protein GCM10009678_05080 [Actinomadura kijaniata]|uniref:Uncharacterized protein n=1 Tax=Actinomadura namibiensis TaxID=182080 RepID=A0A7W3LTC1_ACTNM|nr:hypothetical protein [Actinomadura namibiensis]MBA8953928.1 hypothetical protein [Actinomadura namibiensis]